MFRSSLPFSKAALPGVVSPYLNVYQPKVLGDVLRLDRTTANVNMIMDEVFRAHKSQNHPIFPETKELIQASNDLDPRAFTANFKNLVDSKHTNIPLFDAILHVANDNQKFEALKIAFKNDDINSASKILSSLKNQQKILDKLFLELRNHRNFSLQVIREFLPLCSEDVQSRFLKEMIIQKNEKAVSEIILFYKPTDEHKKLAKTHFTSAILLKIFRQAGETIRDRVETLTGMINVSLVEEMKSGVKQTGKQLVATARETTKFVLRRMGLIAQEKEIVAFDKDRELENLNGLAFDRNQGSYFDDEQTLSLNSETQRLDKTGVSIAQSMKQAILGSSMATFIGEKARIALPLEAAARFKGMEKESEKSFTLPRTSTNTQEGKNRGFGRAAIGATAAIGLATLISRSTKREETELESPVEEKNSSEKIEENIEPGTFSAPLANKSPLKAEYNSSTKEAGVSQVNEQDIVVIKRNIEKSSNIQQAEIAPKQVSKIVVKIFSDEYFYEKKLGKSNIWAHTTAQWEKDLQAGYWR